jgi:lysophospholipase L1-like esterase
VASESQAGPTGFGGFFAGPRTHAAPLPRRTRSIEFIGDSYTVGYGNSSATRQCTEEEVWATTDTTRSPAAIAAKHYEADFQVNAISGRGIVRNYNGFAGDTLPQVYPYALFDKAQEAHQPKWHPQAIVMSLGTNDFSTPLRPGEKWKNRGELRSDFRAAYLRFVRKLRSRHPGAYILLWAVKTDSGELESEVLKIAGQLRKAQDARVGFVLVGGLAFSGCNAHPSIADDRKIAAAITRHIDAQPNVWRASH